MRNHVVPPSSPLPSRLYGFAVQKTSVSFFGPDRLIDLMPAWLLKLRAWEADTYFFRTRGGSGQGGSEGQGAGRPGILTEESWTVVGEERHLSMQGPPG